MIGLKWKYIHNYEKIACELVLITLHIGTWNFGSPCRWLLSVLIQAWHGMVLH